MDNYVLVRSTSTFFTWQMFGDFFLKMHISLHVYCNPTVSWLLFCLDQFHWLTMFSENAHLPLHVLHALHVYCHPIGFYFVWIYFIGRKYCHSRLSSCLLKAYWLLFCQDQFHWLAMFSENAHHFTCLLHSYWLLFCLDQFHWSEILYYTSLIIGG